MDETRALLLPDHSLLHLPALGHQARDMRSGIQARRRTRCGGSHHSSRANAVSPSSRPRCLREGSLACATSVVVSSPDSSEVP